MATEMRVYVGTYSKYNSGSIAGAWFDLADYSDKETFIEACRELHQDEADPELMFQDWEDIPASMISECSIDVALWEIMDEPDLDAVKAYLSIFGAWDADDFSDRYRGHFDGWVAMAEELMEETGELETIPEHLRNYFDFDAYARDLRLGGDMCEDCGHFFWNN